MNGHEVYVDHFCFALGDEKFSVEDSVAAGRTRSAAAELLDAGFRYHYVAGEGIRAYDLARLAVEPIVEGLGPGRRDHLRNLLAAQRQCGESGLLRRER